MMGLHGSNNNCIKSLWINYGHSLYKASMSRDRFKTLNTNLKTNYYPDENITVDEQLFPFRGRTQFTQYIPSKPAKYGINVFWLCNSLNGYPLNGIVYTGKPSADSPRQTNVGENVVLSLIEPYKHSGRNVTTDNFFTSLSLANNLRIGGLSLVGTMRSNKSSIPCELRPNPSDQIGEARYGFQKNTTLVVSLAIKRLFISCLPCIIITM